ncbi:Uncharacterised protein [Mycobacteroides abscessus subsp. abscessus]|uniref:hypothetical protein n=1 Tax=Mycobacteroides abscessus TaxID=36809 RepID=UPI00092B23BA|nr:hypothetical protein [Mycobacteroides abscessus]MDO3315708.1 hypothetical protein [Mycobacteroides abscessus subsp. abscessus]MDO3343111.1 hypothetical protein [Mycobacteroides abscessus subsp. abscessus]SHP29053.1 Uncharacterised protein [Mycobacteroides abscessus subsp. abscessus]SHP46046.1 Uncharacterised protein [Mycobacteroides abscessus subsp. abscessus]SHP49490.1 Uncharacterised protein [Mycobacteroides abscessus subsp. abscessus]
MTGDRPCCPRCGRAGAEQLCEACTEAVAAGLESAAGLPAGGRDPEVVRREIRCRRAGAAFLLHALIGDEQGREAAMRLVIVECAATPGLTPNALLLPQIIDLVFAHVKGAAREQLLGGLRRELLVWATTPDPQPLAPFSDSGGGQR